MTVHPYRGLPSYQFWSSAVSAVPQHEIDPVVESTLHLGPDDSVATMGSCFAQHVSRYLERSGGTYFVPESAPEGLDADCARRRQYGVFSARYGNVYTVRQAVQLFDRAFGRFEPDDETWIRDGALVDPFRPQIEPDGFADVDRLRTDRARHLAAVERVFRETDVLVFTLGLTEGWMRLSDGAVLPLAPGVAGGSFDPDRYQFVNFRCAEVIDDLLAFGERFHSVNPEGRLLLTVSPVPLVATYERRHVLVSTTYSKSVLRVAASEAVEKLPFAHYFPSYEIITGPGQADRYFADDLREVSEEGVAHVMRVFARHYLESSTALVDRDASVGAAAEFRWVNDVVCEEIEIERSL